MSTLKSINIIHPSGSTNNIVNDSSGNITVGGTASASAIIPTGSSVPTNGEYLPAANTLAWATASTERFRVGSSGQLGIGGATYGTSGQVLTSGGSGAAPSWTTVGGFSNLQVFTGDGTFTVPAGITKVKVTVIGGGGGGGSAGGGNYGSGGGGGGAAIEVISGLTPGGTVSVTVGTGGAAGSAGNTSSFGAYCSATGGSAGAQNTAGGAGGVGSSGDLNIAGGGGAGYSLGGAGGSSIYGGGGRGGVSSTGGAGGAYGGGGGGVFGSGTGGAGAAGVVIVEY